MFQSSFYHIKYCKGRWMDGTEPSLNLTGMKAVIDNLGFGWKKEEWFFCRAEEWGDEVDIFSIRLNSIITSIYPCRLRPHSIESQRKMHKFVKDFNAFDAQD